MSAEDQLSGARYTAFLSYSHRDKAFARRLQSQLERYRLPRGVQVRGSTTSSFGRRLGSIFRDQNDLPAAPDLTEAVRTAIAASDWLIVVCSPNAATSIWVELEIHLFRALKGDGKILAALVQGEPEQAFPPAMRESVAGALPPNPVAADFRPHGDGDTLAFLKLAAVLAGVEVDALAHRDAHRRMRRMAMVSGGSIAAVAVMGALTTAAILARNAAVDERNRSVKVVDYMLGDLRSRLKGVGRLDVLQAGEEGALRYYQGQDVAKLPAPAVIEHAKLLQSMGEDDTKRGDLPAAHRKFDEAERETASLIHVQPNNPKLIFAHAQSRYWSGFVRWREGDLIGAKTAFDDYTTLARRLVEIDPKNPDWRMEVGYAESNLGVFGLRQSEDVVFARRQFSAALTEFENALARKPGDRDIRKQIADGFGWLANVERVSGRYSEAVAWRGREDQELRDLLRTDPNDAEIKGAMVSNQLSRARILTAQGRYLQAIHLLETGRSKAKALVTADPKDMDSALDARAFDLFEVQAWILLSPHTRPSLTSLETRLGDCSDDKRTRHSDELFVFCHLLASRIGLEKPSTPPKSTTKLTERWLIDYSDI